MMNRQSKTILPIVVVGLAAAALATACGSKGNDNGNDGGSDGGNEESTPVAAGIAESLKVFNTWTPVLNNDVPFPSKGHGGALVRSYLDPTLTAHLELGGASYPLPAGSVLAKAIIATPETPALGARTVYLMRKEPAGFDAANGDWSYYVAKRKGDQLEIDASLDTKASLCVSCHSTVKAFDYAQTVDFYLKQSTGD